MIVGGMPEVVNEYITNKDLHAVHVIESKETATKYESSIEWLREQLLITQIHNLKRIEYPLEAYADNTNFRIYPTDIGVSGKMVTMPLFMLMFF